MVLQDMTINQDSMNHKNYQKICLVCADGDMVITNPWLLSSLSKWIYSLVMEQSNQDEIVIMFPDFHSESIINLIQTTQNVIEDSTLKTLRKQRPDVILPWNNVLSLGLKFLENKLDSKIDSNEEDMLYIDNIIKEKYNEHISIQKVTTHESLNVFNPSTNMYANYDKTDSSGKETQDRDKIQKEFIDNNVSMQEVETDRFSKMDGTQFSLSKVSPYKNYKNNDNAFSNEMDTTDPIKVKGEKVKNSIVTQKAEIKILETNNSLNSNSMAKPISSSIQQKKKKRTKFQREKWSELKQIPKRKKMTRVEYRNSFLKSKLCPHCGVEFECRDKISKRIYTNHISKHRSLGLQTKVEKFVCECQEKWDNNAQKLRHIKVQHYGYVKCTMCLKTFRNLDSLNNHMQKKHDNSSKEDILCSICGKSSKSYHSLYAHIKSNHDKQVVKCEECGKEIKGAYRLRHHRVNVHNRNPCPICGVAFNKKRMKVHTQAMHTEDKDKKYICDICKKGFPQKMYLDKHSMNVHIKARPYNCRYGCTFAYNDISNRNSHEKKKHGSLYKEKSN